jgi:Domain of unknown function (DUF4760)
MAPPYWWVQPSVVAVGLLVSLFAALYTVYINRRTARIKATLDLIEASESKDRYLDLYKNYKDYRDSEEFRNGVILPTTEDHKTNRRLCFDFLNHYELVAVGIKEGILDERFYKTWMEYAVVRDYRAAFSLIQSARSPTTENTSDISAYSEWEELCVKWGAERIPPVSPSAPADKLSGASKA